MQSLDLDRTLVRARSRISQVPVLVPVARWESTEYKLVGADNVSQIVKQRDR